MRRRRTLAGALVAASVITVWVVRSSSGPKQPTGKKATSVSHSAPSAVRVEAQQAPWLLPAPVSRAVAVADGSGLFIAGGLDANQESSARVFHLDPNSGALTQTGTMVSPTHDAAGAWIGGRLFVFGGGAQTTVDTVQSVPATGPATVAAHLPQPRSDLAAVEIGGTVYLVGGYDGQTPTREVLATTDGITFRVAARLPVGVRYPAVSTIGSVLYVFGGESAGAPSATVQAIDTRTGDARVVGRLPQPRTAASAFSIGGALFVAGGRTAGGPSSDILRFDPAHDSFAPAGSLPAPVADSAAAVVGNRAYLVGGEGTTSVAGVVIVSPTTA